MTTSLAVWPRHRMVGWWRYGRCWTRRLSACRLVNQVEESTLIPRLLRVEVTDSIDRVLVRMVYGQCPADWENRTTLLAQAFGASACHAELVGPSTVELLFLHPDSPMEGGSTW